jgi:hypothetical protein
MAVLRAGSVDCPACGPQPGSRAHQRAGATVVLALRSSVAEVVLAERALKTAHAGEILNKRTRKMPPTFGQGTEMLRHGVGLNLANVLAGAEDITHLF